MASMPEDLTAVKDYDVSLPLSLPGSADGSRRRSGALTTRREGGPLDVYEIRSRCGSAHALTPCASL